MQHSFNTDEAKDYGLFEAVLLDNIRFWVLKNKANKKHFHDGKYWTYNSYKAFSELFPYRSPDQIRRSLDRLLKLGVIVKGKYNSKGYDKTSWYSLSDIMWQNCQMDVAKLPEQIGKNARPIPDTSPYSDHIPKKKKRRKKENSTENENPDTEEETRFSFPSVSRGEDEQHNSSSSLPYSNQKEENSIQEQRIEEKVSQEENTEPRVREPEPLFTEAWQWVGKTDAEKEALRSENWERYRQMIFTISGLYDEEVARLRKNPLEKDF